MKRKAGSRSVGARKPKGPAPLDFRSSGLPIPAPSIAGRPDQFGNTTNQPKSTLYANNMREAPRKRKIQTRTIFTLGDGYEE